VEVTHGIHRGLVDDEEDLIQKNAIVSYIGVKYDNSYPHACFLRFVTFLFMYLKPVFIPDPNFFHPDPHQSCF
jgi:hypothetical protein